MKKTFIFFCDHNFFTETIKPNHDKTDFNKEFYLVKSGSQKKTA